MEGEESLRSAPWRREFKPESNLQAEYEYKSKADFI